MGVVYKAKHVPLNRTVAVKLIRPDRFASDAERRRFRNEAEAVATLDHPNIVTLYEVGRSAGYDYFSMKLVEGVSLDQRLIEFAADPKASVRLMTSIAEGVHHAHQRGILHRDLKPANILLDVRGEPHVADFGLAKRVEAEVDLTHSGAIMGTPCYMSPEQALGVRGSFTTSTDVYGLGSILYALLAGRAPFAGSSLVETLDKVRGEMPELPSKSSPRVPRDLEIICMKCLEKEPHRRYASALDLVADLTRWRNGEPIAARPVGLLSRAGMWCRRQPLPAGLAASLALAVIAGLAGVTWNWREAARERATGEKINEFLVKKLLARAPVDLLDQAAERLGSDFAGQPEVEAAIREKVGLAYHALGHYAAAEPHLRAAQSLGKRLQGPHGRTPIRAANELGLLLDDAGRSSEAEPLARQTFETSRTALGPNDPTTLDAADTLGVILRHLKRWDEAETMLRETLATRRRVLVAGHEDTLRSVNHLGLLLQDREKLAEADTLAREYQDGVRCLFGTRSPDNVVALTNLAQLRLHQGKRDEAVAYYREAVDSARRTLGPEHPKTRVVERNLVDVLERLGQ
jgi:tetratricopeptide (TPR) repeat protein